MAWRRGARPAAALCAAGALALLTGSAPAGSAEAPEYAVDCLAVGAYVASPEWSGDSLLSLFAEADAAMGPLTIRRSFDPSLPSSFADSAGGRDLAAGLHSFVSWKPPHRDFRGAAAGRYDREIAAWARSVPTTGVFATAYHEPENDMTAAEFVAFQRHVYTVVKEANPAIRWGPVYMAYWWDPAEPAHYVGDPAAWWPGEDYADFVGFDWYGHDPEPMTTSPSFRHWYAHMAPTGLPLYVVEYGQYELRPGQASQRDRELARAAAIRQDAQWIAGHPQIAMWLYWQGPGHRDGDWRMRDEESRRAWAEVARSGCPGGHEQ